MRRVHLAVLVVVISVASMVIVRAQPGIAQQATPVAGPPATPVAASHPIQGSWFLYDSLSPRKSEGHWMITLSADGTASGAAQWDEFSAVVGAWAETGDNTAVANLVVFSTSEGYGDEIWTFHLTITWDETTDELAIETRFDNVLQTGAVDANVDPNWAWRGIRITADPEQVVGPPSPTP